MITDPHLVHFACIAKDTTILAEFNSKDAALSAIAVKCLGKTPPFHAIFTHTVRSMTYTLLIDKPFVYFAIFDEKLEKSEGLAFLKSVRNAFREIYKEQKMMENLNSNCFQGDFNPVFRRLLGPGLDHMEGFTSPVGQRMGQSGLIHVRGQSLSAWDNSLMRMKKMFMGEFEIGRRNSEKKDNDSDGGSGIGLSREFSLVMHRSGGLYPSELIGPQKARKAWKKHVWCVLFLDLIFCAALFGIWVCVCRGFECMGN